MAPTSGSDRYIGQTRRLKQSYRVIAWAAVFARLNPM
jgi:hypothetical protein